MKLGRKLVCLVFNVANSDDGKNKRRGSGGGDTPSAVGRILMNEWIFKLTWVVYPSRLLVLIVSFQCMVKTLQVILD